MYDRSQGSGGGFADPRIQLAETAAKQELMFAINLWITCNKQTDRKSLICKRLSSMLLPYGCPDVRSGASAAIRPNLDVKTQGHVGLQVSAVSVPKQAKLASPVSICLRITNRTNHAIGPLQLSVASLTSSAPSKR